jgi:quercetin dioxygenase-like cupin family protein
MTDFQGLAKFPPRLVRPEDREPFPYFTTTCVMPLRPEDTGGVIAIVHGLFAPGAAPPRHVHTREDETFYVISGMLRFYIGDEEPLDAPAGTVVFAPRNLAHTFDTLAPTSEFLVIMTPGWGGAYFPQVGAKTRTPGNEDIELLREYGVEVVGPPPTDSQRFLVQQLTADPQD